jgi:hypothetical protein
VSGKDGKRCYSQQPHQPALGSGVTVDVALGDGNGAVADQLLDIA